MDKYQFLRKKPFESIAKFEKRLNEVTQRDWKAIGMITEHGQITILLERIKNDDL